MVEHALKHIKPIISGDVSQVEIKKSAELNFTADIQKALKKTVWMNGGCSSWYKTEEGWNSTVYPYTQIDFTLRNMFPNYKHWDYSYTKKGLIKGRIEKFLRLLTYAAAFFALYRAKQNGYTVKGFVRYLSSLKMRADIIRQVGVAIAKQKVKKAIRDYKNPKKV
jgi:hypothetical protein